VNEPPADADEAGEAADQQAEAHAQGYLVRPQERRMVGVRREGRPVQGCG